MSHISIYERKTATKINSWNGIKLLCTNANVSLWAVGLDGNETVPWPWTRWPLHVPLEKWKAS